MAQREAWEQRHRHGLACHVALLARSHREFARGYSDFATCGVLRCAAVGQDGSRAMTEACENISQKIQSGPQSWINSYGLAGAAGLGDGLVKCISRAVSCTCEPRFEPASASDSYDPAR